MRFQVSERTGTTRGRIIGGIRFGSRPLSRCVASTGAFDPGIAICRRSLRSTPALTRNYLPDIIPALFFSPFPQSRFRPCCACAWVVVRWLFAPAMSVVAAPSARGAAGQAAQIRPGRVPPLCSQSRRGDPLSRARRIRRRSALGRRQGAARVDRSGHGRAAEGKESRAVRKLRGRVVDAVETGPNDGAGFDVDPDVLELEDEGPGMRPLRRLCGCFGPVINGRYRDAGHPLDRESWMNRPFSISLFAGSLAADALSSNRILAGTGFFGGVRWGWDYSYFGGFETRLGWTKVALDYPNNPTIIGDGNFLLWDASWLYYPWGDTQWRPFALVGLGMADMKFINDQGLRDHDVVFGLPLGIGFKYRWDAKVVFRFDITDNIAFAAGNGLDDMSHFSFTGAGVAFWRRHCAAAIGPGTPLRDVVALRANAASMRGFCWVPLLVVVTAFMRSGCIETDATR